MAKETLEKARKNKADEFYTQMQDIENEIKSYLNYNSDVFRNKTILCPCDDPEWSNFTKYFALNFEKLGIKKLISTSFASESKSVKFEQLSLFEINSKKFDKTKSHKCGKIFILEKDENKNGVIDIEDIKWKYLKGDGDFRSDEVTKLRNEADFIITNPPFSLFREFVKWIMEAQKKFLVISNMNAITYKEIFPLIQENFIWMGIGFGRSFKGFIVPENYPLNGTETRIDVNGNRIVSTNSTIWLTNIEHDRRHKPLELMSMENNFKLSKHKKIREKGKYDLYDNYDAIDVPFTSAIPSDYKGAMGVPISFLHKYCPEQFEIVKFRKGNDGKDLKIQGKCPYFRIIIRNKML